MFQRCSLTITLLWWLLFVETNPVLAIEEEKVIELGVDNFYATVKDRPWTCILFYDPLDQDKLSDYHDLMTALLGLEASNVTIARMDGRRHAVYREAYQEDNGLYSKKKQDTNAAQLSTWELLWDLLKEFARGLFFGNGGQQETRASFLEDYYEGFPDEVDGDFLVISDTNFMRNELLFPSSLILMGSDFNGYGELQLAKHDSLAPQVDVAVRWLEDLLHKLAKADEDEKDLEGFIETKNPVQVLLERMEDPPEDFLSDSLVETIRRETVTPAKTQDIRFALEAGATPMEDADGFFQYRSFKLDELPGNLGTQSWLLGLGYVLDRYLVWVEGYETLWGPERRQREDATCQFGTHLDTMNQEARRLVDDVFADNDNDNDRTTDNYNKVPLALKTFLNDLVFGYGRSPTSLKWYLENEVRDKLGPDAAARRQNRNTTASLPVFESMRGYMKVMLDSMIQEDLYEGPISQLAAGFQNILVKFHTNLSQSYLQYRQSLPTLDDTNEFKRQSIEVLDMDDPIDQKLLGDYDAFHRKYTQTSTPVILGNVQMTKHNLTLEYLAQECGGMDVQENVKISSSVGDKAANEWGGLKQFALSSYGDHFDNRISLQQFLALQEKLGNLYLHDLELPQACPNLLYEETMYGPNQKFRIPSVVGAWDLFHRASASGFDKSWPSLFLGKKGSNSKMHVDRGATGFFMYLVEGRKRWIVTDRSERVFLYQKIEHSHVIPDVLGIDKSEEANAFLNKRFPLLQRMEGMYEVVQEPGQLIYIPPNCPHAVENLDDTIGVALNLVPKDGVGIHIHDLIHVDREFGHVQTTLDYWLYSDNAHKEMSSKDPLYMSFAAYKGQV